MINKSIRSQKGITLIEILVAIVILGIIVVSFIPLFIQSARTISQSEEMIDATYVAQSLLEDIYFISKNSDVTLQNELIDLGYEEDLANCQSSSLCFHKEENGYYVRTELSHLNSHDSLPHVIIKIYEDQSKQKLEAQMETVLP
ncbi:type II secretion system protein [Bacillus sp. J37]|uniref:type IV pilus modification PilV family protein n=1 Tax=Bacillus sp. J37 TaxID=935837 RepID=UPI0004B5DF9D|nr:type II secretion system protein [Bacillus sp. J37]